MTVLISEISQLEHLRDVLYLKPAADDSLFAFVVVGENLEIVLEKELNSVEFPSTGIRPS